MEEIKIGLLGLGNVGTGVFEIIQRNGGQMGLTDGVKLKVEKILVKDVNKPRRVAVEASVLTDRIEEIIGNPEISVVAEFMGGVEPAREYVLSALRGGKTVVTANKELVARCWQELDDAARQNGTGLYYEASVAGGIPIIKVMNESLQANRIKEIMGIINGTTNYILTKMSEEGRDFHDVLAEAQRLGYAEPDPTADVEGYDAMYKLSILSSLAFRTRVHTSDIYREGITGITVEDIQYGRELGFAIRLLGIAKNREGQVEVRVHPTFIPVEHPLAAVRDSFNAIFVKGDAVGNLMLYGRGAGDLPTGSAIVSDIVTACHRKGRHWYAPFYSNGEQAGLPAFQKDWESEYFIRLTVKDRPGVLARIAGIFGHYEVSIASLIQKDRGKDVAPLIFVTHRAKELSLQQAIADIGRDDNVVRVENVIRVER